MIPCCANRGDVDVFIHPNTGDDLLDHTQHIMWIGESYPLNLSVSEGDLHILLIDN